jgi:hypothetical protein
MPAYGAITERPPPTGGGRLALADKHGLNRRTDDGVRAATRPKSEKNRAGTYGTRLASNHLPLPAFCCYLVPAPELK